MSAVPYKDPAAQAKAQREWIARRRAEWLEGKVCARCGGDGPFEIDHIDRSAKVTHRVWSWSEARREAELAKCQVLCVPCHRAKTNTEVSVPLKHGLNGYLGTKRCRCPVCTAANTEYRRMRRAAKLDGRTQASVVSMDSTALS